MKKKTLITVALSALVVAGCRAPAGVPMTQTPVPPTVAVTEEVPPTASPTAVPAEEVPLVLEAAPPRAEPLDVATEKDIPYTRPLQPEVAEQMLDVYYPEDKGSWPVVLLLPRLSPSRSSGAYVELAELIAGQGVVVFLADFGTWDNYFPVKAASNNGRLFRQIHEEIACALSYVGSEAAQYGGNQENLILLGHDTGGLYGLDVGLLRGRLESAWDAFAEERGGPPVQAECLANGELAEVDALISYAGQFFHLRDLEQTDAELSRLVNPLALMGENLDMRIALMAIMSDSDIPVEPSIETRDGLISAGYQVEFYPLYINSTNIKMTGPELAWILNAVLQYAQP